MPNIEGKEAGRLDREEKKNHGQLELGGPIDAGNGTSY